jgi:hypothetical protein
MAIAACFVFQREISRSLFWDFFDSIGPSAKWRHASLRKLTIPRKGLALSHLRKTSRGFPQDLAAECHITSRRA